MKKNLGNIDRIIRGVAGLGILILFATKIITGQAVFFMGIVALVLLLTSVTSFCPCYIRLNINTAKSNSEKNKEL